MSRVGPELHAAVVDGASRLVAGRFRLEGRLGEGSAGLVYRAFDEEQGTFVALKKLKNVEPSALVRFKREFRTLQDARLHHVNLVRLRELFEANGEWYLSMELVDGTDLLRYVRPGDEPRVVFASNLARTSTLADGPQSSERATVLGAESGHRAERTPRGALDESRLRSCLRQLAYALQALHAAGNVHRDVKPSNVRVTPEGRLVLLDMGLLAESDVHNKERVGTALYMAPEQGRAATLGPAADFYALGVVLYEALTGLLPFSGTTREIQSQKEAARIPRPRLFSADISEDLEALCLALLEPEPALRATGDVVLQRVGDEEGLVPALRARAPQAPSVTQANMVGRERELAALGAALAASQNGLVIVSVTGESGIGKSTLVRWFARHTLPRLRPEAIALVSQCFQPEYVGFKAFDGIVDELARFLLRAPARVVDELVPPGGGLLTRTFPVLLGLEAFERARATATVSLDPREHRPLVCAAMRELLSRVAERWTLSIVIDDLQWSDEDSLFMLEMLVRSPQPLPITLIVTSRPGPGTPVDVQPLLRTLAPELVHLPLSGLTGTDARILAHSLLPTAVDPEAAEAIVREAHGHPLFIEELCLGRHVGGGAGLDEMVSRRLERLAPEARAAIELVALAGVPVDLDVVALALGSLERSELLLSVSSLKRERLLRTSIQAGRERAEIYHARIGAALLAALSTESVRAQHASLAHAAQTLGRGDSEFLARHWYAAGVHDKAAALALMAAEQAASALAFDHACQLLRWSLELVSVEHQPAILRKLGDCLANAGRGVEAAEIYLQIAEQGAGNDELEQRAAEQLLRVGRLTEARVILARVLAREGLALPRTKVEAVARLLLGRLLVRVRGHRVARRLASATELRRADLCRKVAQGLAAIEPIEGALYQTRQLLLALATGDRQQAARALAVEATFLAWGGTKTERRARAALDEATDLMRSHPDDHYTCGTIRWATSIAMFLSCRFRESLVELERAEQLFRRGGVGVSWELAMSRLFSFWSQAHLGRFVELSRSLPAQVELAEKVGDQLSAILLRSGISNATWLALDQPRLARANASLEALGWSQPGFQFQHAIEVAAQSDVDIYERNPSAALQRILRAWPKFRSSGMLQLQYIRINLLDRRGRALVMAGHDWRQALKCARQLEQERVPFADALAGLLRASIARAGGQKKTAQALYAASALAFDALGFRVHGAAARSRQGELTAGSEGAELRSSALEALARFGVVDAERMAALVAPTPSS